MSSNISLRPAQRSDIPALAEMANAANAQSVIHRRVAPYQDQKPIDYYHWRLNIIRMRFATPNLRTIVAIDPSSGELLGHASWTVEGPDTALYKQWASESTWADWLEGKFLAVERTWRRYVMDKSIDYKFLSRFIALSLGAEQPPHPACLQLQLIVVSPSTQSRGVGRMLIDWGKELAMREGLPIFLEANLEATGFYDKGGFSRLSKDIVVDVDGRGAIHLPAYAWEGRQREGRWLERDENFKGSEVRWKWRDDVLPKSTT